MNVLVVEAVTTETNDRDHRDLEELAGWRETGKSGGEGEGRRKRSIRLR